MRQWSFVIFVGSFLLIYSLAHVYVWSRLRTLWPYSERGFVLFTIVFVLFACAFVAGRFSLHAQSLAHEIIAWIGAFWLVIALYLFLLLVIYDVLRLANGFIPFLPAKGSSTYLRLNSWIFHGMFGVVFLVVLVGYINALFPRVKEIEIETTKQLGCKGELSVVAVSDLHLGSLVGKHRMQKLVRIVNGMQPDVIIIAGDLLDEAHGFIVKHDIGAPLRQLKATYGVYAVPGNHEYIGGIQSSEQYIKTLSLHWLKDSVVKVNDFLTLIGRDDKDASRMIGRKRKTLDELLMHLDSNQFNLLIDHQPVQIEEVVRYPIDLQISGHTHNGQFWPFNHVVKWVYTLSYEYMRIGNTHFYVSSGYGTWGPPVRIATIPEVIHFKIRQR